MQPIPTYKAGSKNRNSYEMIGWLAILYANLLILPVIVWLDKSLTDTLCMVMIGLMASYAFNVIKAFLSATKEHSFYHYYLLMGAVVFLWGWFLGKNLLELADVFALYMAIIGAIGRIGCFHSGCCYGKKRKFSIRFYPTQIMESLLGFFNFSLGIVLLLFINQEGIVFSVLTASYAFGRFLLELLRADSRPYFLGISEAQWIGIALLSLVCFLSQYFTFWLQILTSVLLIIQIILSLILISQLNLRRKKGNSFVS